MGYLQLARGEELKDRSEKNYLRVVSLETQRGIIYDRDGNLLAYDEVIEAKNLRKYPSAGFLHVLGFLTAPEKEGGAPKGASGLEATYDEILRGSPDKNIEEIDAKGNILGQGILEKGQEIVSEDNSLALVSCYPPGKDLQRITVQAEIDSF